MTTLPHPLSRKLPFANPQLRAVAANNLAQIANAPVKPLQKIMAGNVPNPIYPGMFLFPTDWTAQIPPTIDLRFTAPPIEDQGSVGDCTGNALCGSLEFFQQRAGNFAPLSELFNYWYSRFVYFGAAPTYDSGSTSQAALQALQTYGICSEGTWPTSSDELTQPSAAAIAEAAQFKISKFSQIVSLGSWWDYEKMIYAIQYALSKGYTVMFSLNVGSAIFNLKPTDVYGPINTSTNPLAGGHDVVICGYTGSFDDGTLKFIVRNSWGTAYCDQGYFYMSPSVIVSDGDEMWVVQGFMGYTKAGDDVTKNPTVPSSTTSLIDTVNYIFRIKFGRESRPAGQSYWTLQAMNYLNQIIPAGAAGADATYMQTHPPLSVGVPPTANSTLGGIVNYIFQKYFGRVALQGGQDFYSAAALQYLVTSIVGSASNVDKQFMIDNNISTSALTRTV